MLLRVRCPAGTWRFDGLEADDLLKVLMERIEKEKQIAVSAQIISVDPAGAEPLDSESTLKALGLAHGAMLHLKYGDETPATAGPRVISADGSIETCTCQQPLCVLSFCFAAFDTAKGFRPGMRSLRSIKMNW